MLDGVLVIFILLKIKLLPPLLKQIPLKSLPGKTKIWEIIGYVH